MSLVRLIISSFSIDRRMAIDRDGEVGLEVVCEVVVVLVGVGAALEVVEEVEAEVMLAVVAAR